jgi:hypothetical protein
MKSRAKPTGTQYPTPADFAPTEPETQYNVGRITSVAVDHLTPTARDKIEDMKATRDNDKLYGWE